MVYEISCGLVIYDFYYVEIHFHYKHFADCFYYKKRFLIYSNSGFDVIEMIIWFLSIIFFMEHDFWMFDSPISS